MGTAQPRDGFPCWVDLIVDDVDRALGFYADVLGWTPGERSGPEFGGYAMWFRDGVPTAGVGPVNGGAPPAWTVYLATSDIDATLSTAASSGGRVLAPAMQIGPLGRMAVLADPADTVIGLWQPLDFAGFGRYAEPGFFDWCVVHSTDTEATLRFLEELFGYAESRPDPAPSTGDYRQLDIDGTPALGLLPASRSSCMPYIAVDDTDAAAQRAVDAGGAVVRTPEATVFGRLASIADPEGAVISIASA